MNYENIKFQIKDGVALLTLNRPDKLNSFTQAMHLEVRSALDRNLCRCGSHNRVVKAILDAR